MAHPEYSVADAELAHMTQAAAVVDVFNDEHASVDHRSLELGNYAVMSGLLADAYDDSATITTLITLKDQFVIASLRMRATSQVRSWTLFEWGLVQAGTTIPDAGFLTELAYRPNISRYFWALEHLEPEYDVPGAKFVRKNGEIRGKELDYKAFVEGLAARVEPIIPAAA